MSERRATARLEVVGVAISLIATSASGAITGGDSRAITGGDSRAITGGDSRAITGGDSRAITGGDSRAITGGDSRAITGGDSRAITGGDSRAITGGDSRAITGGDSRAITGGDARLILLGRISVMESDFVSVLGQSIFLDQIDSEFGVGKMVAVYGSIDTDTGGVVNATVIDSDLAGFAANSPSFLNGIVDEVDAASGKAVVSGLLVDYTALLSTGWAPSVGDEVAVTGYHYGDLGMLVAEPQ